MLIIFSYFFLGAFAGVVSGLIGVSGGVVIVPGLALLFHWQGFPNDVVMHLAIGTSLAITVITAGRSFLGHIRSKIPWWPLYRRIVIGLVLGVIAGTALASQWHSDTLQILFGCFMILIAIKMFFQKTHADHEAVTSLGVWVSHLLGVITGFASGVLGIGGGTVIIPTLVHYKINMRQAILVALGLGVTVTLIGSLSFIIVAQHSVDLPIWTTGYIYWPAWAATALGSLFFAPFGVKLSFTLPTKILVRAFSCFLLGVALHMLGVIA